MAWQWTSPVMAEVKVHSSDDGDEVREGTVDGEVQELQCDGNLGHWEQSLPRVQGGAYCTLSTF